MDDVFQCSLVGFAGDGYEWRSGPFVQFPEGTEHDEPALIALGGTDRHYKPETDLFLKFAAIDPEDDAQILAFAGSYGLLQPANRYAPSRTPSSETAKASVGELRSLWRKNLPPMKMAVSLWQAINNSDRALLAKTVVWQNPHHIVFHWPPSSDWNTPWSTHATIASTAVNPDFLKRFPPAAMW